MNVMLTYAISALLIVTAVLSYIVGAYTSSKNKDAREALTNSYIEQELLREQIYLMRVAGAPTQGTESSVAARRSHHPDFQ